MKGRKIFTTEDEQEFSIRKLHCQQGVQRHLGNKLQTVVVTVDQRYK